MPKLIKVEDIDVSSVAMQNDTFKYIAVAEYQGTTFEVLGDISDIQRSVITDDQCNGLAVGALERRVIKACDRAARLWLAEVLTEGLS